MQTPVTAKIGSVKCQSKIIHGCLCTSKQTVFTRWPHNACSMRTETYVFFCCTKIFICYCYYVLMSSHAKCMWLVPRLWRKDVPIACFSKNVHFCTAASIFLLPQVIAKIACLFSIACGGKKSIPCGGKGASLMTGYIKPIACGSELLCSTCAHTWRCVDDIFLALTRRFLYSLPTRTLRYALSSIHVISCEFYTFTGNIATLTYIRFMSTSFSSTGFHCFYWCFDWRWLKFISCLYPFKWIKQRGLEQLFSSPSDIWGLFDSVTIGKTYVFW